MTIIDRVRGWFASWSRTPEAKTVYDIHFHAGAVVNVNAQCCREPDRRPGRFIFRLGPVTDADSAPNVPQRVRQLNGESDVIQEVETRQTGVITIEKAVNRRGDDAPIDGPPQWGVSSGDHVVIEPATDGMSCKWTTTVVEGTVDIVAVGDGDMGPDVKEIRGTHTLVIKAPPASEFVMSGGPATDAPAPEPQPIPTPPE